MVNSILVDYDLSENFKSELIFYDYESRQESRLLLEIGKKLDWYCHPDKFCIGYHTYDEYHDYTPCPTHQKIDKGVQCDYCKNRDLLIPCMLCKGDECINNESVKENCDVTPTSVYLVTFGGEIKVGVSKKDRLQKRWLEQGAELASEVGLFPNGLIARAAEESISWDFAITKGIKLKTKFSRVAEHVENVLDEKKFQEMVIKIGSWVENKFGKETLGDKIIKNLTPHYNVVKNAKRVDTDGNVALKGEFTGMKGPIFLFKSFGQDFFLDIRKLRGRKIGDSPAEGSQGILSDYF